LRLSPLTQKEEQPPRSAIDPDTQAALEKVMEMPAMSIEKAAPKQPEFSRINRPTYERSPLSHAYPVEKATASTSRAPAPVRYTPAAETLSGGIVEQAWIMKMAGEIARRAQDEKPPGNSFWSTQSEREDTPPPAYEFH